MSKARQVMLAAGVGGLLVWIGVRGSTWLKGKLAYHRWRRQRFHSIILRTPEDGDRRLEQFASGRALVWDGEGGQAPATRPLVWELVGKGEGRPLGG